MWTLFKRRSPASANLNIQSGDPATPSEISARQDTAHERNWTAFWMTCVAGVAVVALLIGFTQLIPPIQRLLFFTLFWSILGYITWLFGAVGGRSAAAAICASAAIGALIGTAGTTIVFGWILFGLLAAAAIVLFAWVRLDRRNPERW